MSIWCYKQARKTRTPNRHARLAAVARQKTADLTFRSVTDYARWFASQGGKARSKALTREERRAISRKGGAKRWRGTTAAERSAAMRKAVEARWSGAKKRSR